MAVFWLQFSQYYPSQGISILLQTLTTQCLHSTNQPIDKQRYANHQPEWRPLRLTCVMKTTRQMLRAMLRLSMLAMLTVKAKATATATMVPTTVTKKIASSLASLG